MAGPIGTVVSNPVTVTVDGRPVAREIARELRKLARRLRSPRPPVKRVADALDKAAKDLDDAYP